MHGAKEVSNPISTSEPLHLHDGSNTIEYRSVRQWHPSISPSHIPRTLSFPSTNSLNSCTLLLKYIEQPPRLPQSYALSTNKHWATVQLQAFLDMPIGLATEMIGPPHLCMLFIGARASSGVHYYKNAIRRHLSNDRTEVACCLLMWIELYNTIKQVLLCKWAKI
jgi:hypothetical protein